jgi:hypothetical protein
MGAKKKIEHKTTRNLTTGRTPHQQKQQQQQQHQQNAINMYAI